MDRDYTVRVRAVVMSRDDSSGGWVPLGGGGLSHIMICKVRRTESSHQRDYLIRGERLRDQSTILECVMKKGMVYNKANPIFHHWKVDENKFGLTFQSPVDAVTFEKGMQAAMDELSEGSLSHSSSSSSSTPGEAGGLEDVMPLHTDSESSSNSRKEMLPKHITIVTSESSSSCYARSPASEEFGFSAGPSINPTTQSQPLQRLSFHDEEELENINPCKDLWVSKGYEDYRRPALQRPDQPKSDVRVHFQKASGSKAKERNFPGAVGTSVTEGEGPLKDPRSSPSCRIHGTPSPKSKEHTHMAAEEDTATARCVYCRDVFTSEENGRGQCQDAPDPIGRCFYQLSCMWCAESLLYHCMSDSEGEYSDPCSCDPGHPHFCVRWAALVALSLVVPCMCCYLPLRACHWCGEHCGCCGGRHKAVR